MPHTLSVRPSGKIFAKLVAEARAVTPAAGLTTLVVATKDVPQGSVTGRCVGSDDTSLAAEVTLEIFEPGGLEDYVSRSVTADSDGHFVFRHVPVGVYRVRFTCDGHELVTSLEPLILNEATSKVDLGKLHFAQL